MLLIGELFANYLYPQIPFLRMLESCVESRNLFAAMTSFGVDQF